MVTSLSTGPEEPIAPEQLDTLPDTPVDESPPVPEEQPIAPGAEDTAPVPVEASQPPDQSVQTQVQEPAQPTPDIQAQLRELHNIRQVNAQKEWEQKTVREAQALERAKLEQGMDPQNARQVARQHLTSRKELRDQEGKALSLIEEIEGKHNAALHMLAKHGLANKQVLADLKSLLAFNTPDSMDSEAQRVSQLRKQAAEIARLKQGQVPPQTFDKSQGAAEATSNQGRLLAEDIAGHKTEAHVSAARRAAGMGS